LTLRITLTLKVEGKYAFFVEIGKNMQKIAENGLKSHVFSRICLEKKSTFFVDIKPFLNNISE
jgi:hypothetical protein